MGKDPVSKTKDVRAAVEAELGFDPLVDAADITVRNIAGDVTLTGTVPSYPQYLEAAAAARRVAGVTGVHNHLEVVLPAGIRNVSNDIEISYALDPVEVDLHVQQALDRAALVPDDSDVTADTRDGVITLTGHVRTWAEHDAVTGAALMARGVIDIRDELQVTG
jgi:osmotically-inducible protein OsmY